MRWLFSQNAVVGSLLGLGIWFVIYSITLQKADTTVGATTYHRHLQLGNLFGVTRFIGPGLCWLGVDITRFFDPNDLLEGLGDDGGGGLAGLLDISSLLGSCACKDYQVEERLAAASPDRLSTIELCAGTIRVQKPFDLTNKNVAFSCTTPAIFACGFSALNRSPIFTGAPIAATFTQTKFTKSPKAFDLSGGRLTLRNVGFVNNEGDMAPAICMRDGGTVTATEATFTRNTATGAAVSVYPTLRCRSWFCAHIIDCSAAFWWRCHLFGE